MNLNSIIFSDNLPTLDLHGYDRECARVAINDFIKENLKLENKFIVIIHGIGSGVLKETTHNVLKNNKFVLEYRLNCFNIGTTLVNLDLTIKNKMLK